MYPQARRNYRLAALVVVWSLMGMTIAQTPWLARSGLLQAIFYVVAGLGWVISAMPIISWMARPDASTEPLFAASASTASAGPRKRNA
jgi:hypothetical protein